MTRFGPAGMADSFHAQGYKTALDIPKYLVPYGLNAFEYQCGRGVRISTAMANALGEVAREAGIALSLHAPYYISLASAEEDKRLGSLRYILEAARAVTDMGGQRIVVHPGSAGKLPRGAAMELAGQTMRLALTALREQGYGDVVVCPETMGKTGQLGTLDEVLTLCSLDERMLPCIDFGHLYARSLGRDHGREAFAAVLDAVENRLGYDRLKVFHAHFSKIEYTEKGGERRHVTFESTEYGPDFAPLAELIAQRGLTPTIICESAGTQTEDAAEMLGMYTAARAAL